jgi:hypothetical protein
MLSSPLTPRSPFWFLSFWLSNRYSMCIVLRPILATCHGHLILYDVTILITLSEQFKLWSFSLYSFSLISFHFIPPRSKYPLHHPVLKLMLFPFIIIYNLFDWNSDVISNSFPRFINIHLSLLVFQSCEPVSYFNMILLFTLYIA